MSTYFLVSNSSKQPVDSLFDGLNDDLRRLAERIRKGETGCRSLPGWLQRSAIKQSVVSATHVAFLLEDGRVCRIAYTVKRDAVVAHDRSEDKSRPSTTNQQAYAPSRSSATQPTATSISVAHTYVPTTLNQRWTADATSRLTESRLTDLSGGQSRLAEVGGGLRARIVSIATGNQAGSSLAHRSGRLAYVGRAGSSASVLPANMIPEEIVAQVQSVLQGKSRAVIVRELQRTNLDVNLAVNNLLGRDDENEDEFVDEERLECDSDGSFQDDLVSLLDTQSNGQAAAAGGALAQLDADAALAADMLNVYSYAALRRRAVHRDRLAAKLAAESQVQPTQGGEEKTSALASTRETDVDRRSDEPDVQFSSNVVFWTELNGTSTRFSQIAALRSSLVAISTTGQLHDWRFDSPTPYSRVVEEDAPSRRFYYHPKTLALGLLDERCTLLAACLVRASVVTESGRVATFCDDSIRNVDASSSVRLCRVEQAATSFDAFANDPVRSLACSSLFTLALTRSGALYWFGVMPANGRRRAIESWRTQLRTGDSSSTIRVGSRVRLRAAPVYRAGARAWLVDDAGRVKVGTLTQDLFGVSSQNVIAQFTLDDDTTEADADVDMDAELDAKADPKTLLESLVNERLSASALGSGSGSAPCLRAGAKRAREVAANPGVSASPSVERWNVNDVVFFEDGPERSSDRSARVGIVWMLQDNSALVQFGDASVSTGEAAGNSAIPGLLAGCRMVKRDELVALNDAEGTFGSPDCVQRSPKRINLRNVIDRRATKKPTSAELDSDDDTSKSTPAPVGVRRVLAMSASSGVLQLVAQLTTGRVALLRVTMNDDGEEPGRVERCLPLATTASAFLARSSRRVQLISAPENERFVLLTDGNGCIFPLAVGVNDGRRAAEPKWLDLLPLRCSSIGYCHFDEQSAAPLGAAASALSNNEDSSASAAKRCRVVIRECANEDRSSRTTPFIGDREDDLRSRSVTFGAGQYGRATGASAATAASAQDRAKARKPVLITMLHWRDSELLRAVLRSDIEGVRAALGKMAAGEAATVDLELRTALLTGNRNLLHAAVRLCAPLVNRDAEMNESELESALHDNLDTLLANSATATRKRNSDWTNLYDHVPPPLHAAPASTSAPLNLSSTSNAPQSQSLSQSVSEAVNEAKRLGRMFGELESARRTASTEGFGTGPGSGSGCVGAQRERQPSEKDRSIRCLLVLRCLLESPLVSDDRRLGGLLRARDASGRTPFESAVVQRAYSAAICLLDAARRVANGNVALLRSFIQPDATYENDNDSDSDGFNALFAICYNDTCSFTWTGNEHIQQDIYECRTCNLVGELCCCSECARVCHVERGHDCSLKRNSPTAYCDCWERCDCLSTLAGSQTARFALLRALLATAGPQRLVGMRNARGEHLLIVLAHTVARQAVEQRQFTKLRLRNKLTPGRRSASQQLQDAHGHGHGRASRPDSDLEPPGFARRAFSALLADADAVLSFFVPEAARRRCEAPIDPLFGSYLSAQRSSAQIDAFVHCLLVRCNSEYLDGLLSSLTREPRVLRESAARFVRACVRLYTVLAVQTVPGCGLRQNDQSSHPDELTLDSSSKRRRAANQSHSRLHETAAVRRCRRVFETLPKVAIVELVKSADACVAPLLLGTARASGSFAPLASIVDACAVSEQLFTSPASASASTPTQSQSQAIDAAARIRMPLAAFDEHALRERVSDTEEEDSRADARTDEDDGETVAMQIEQVQPSTSKVAATSGTESEARLQQQQQPGASDAVAMEDVEADNEGDNEADAASGSAVMDDRASSSLFQPTLTVATAGSLTDDVGDASFAYFSEDESTADTVDRRSAVSASMLPPTHRHAPPSADADPDADAERRDDVSAAAGASEFMAFGEESHRAGVGAVGVGGAPFFDAVAIASPRYRPDPDDQRGYHHRHLARSDAEHGFLSDSNADALFPSGIVDEPLSLVVGNAPSSTAATIATATTTTTTAAAANVSTANAAAEAASMHHEDAAASSDSDDQDEDAVERHAEAEVESEYDEADDDDDDDDADEDDTAPIGLEHDNDNDDNENDEMDDAESDFDDDEHEQEVNEDELTESNRIAQSTARSALDNQLSLAMRGDQPATSNSGNDHDHPVAQRAGASGNPPAVPERERGREREPSGVRRRRFPNSQAHHATTTSSSSRHGQPVTLSQSGAANSGQPVSAAQADAANMNAAALLSAAGSGGGGFSAVHLHAAVANLAAIAAQHNAPAGSTYLNTVTQLARAYRILLVSAFELFAGLKQRRFRQHGDDAHTSESDLRRCIESSVNTAQRWLVSVLDSLEAQLRFAIANALAASDSSHSSSRSLAAQRVAAGAGAGAGFAALLGVALADPHGATASGIASAPPASTDSGSGSGQPASSKSNVPCSSSQTDSAGNRRDFLSYIIGLMRACSSEHADRVPTVNLGANRHVAYLADAVLIVLRAFELEHVESLRHFRLASIDSNADLNTTLHHLEAFDRTDDANVSVALDHDTSVTWVTNATSSAPMLVGLPMDDASSSDGDQAQSDAADSDDDAAEFELELRLRAGRLTTSDALFNVFERRERARRRRAASARSQHRSESHSASTGALASSPSTSGGRRFDDPPLSLGAASTFFQRSESTLFVGAAVSDPLATPAREALPLADRPLMLTPQAAREDLFGLPRTGWMLNDSDTTSDSGSGPDAYSFGLRVAGADSGNDQLSLARFVAEESGSRMTRFSTLARRWRVSLELFGRLFTEDCAAERHSLLPAFGGFGVKETRFRRAMEAFRTVQQRDVALQVEREPRALIQQTCKQLNTLFLRKVAAAQYYTGSSSNAGANTSTSSTPSLSQSLVSSSPAAPLSGLVAVLAHPNLAPNSNSHSAPPLACRHVKITFKDEQGEGSGVARSFFTSLGQALTAEQTVVGLNGTLPPASAIGSNSSSAGRCNYSSHRFKRQPPFVGAPQTQSANTSRVDATAKQATGLASNWRMLNVGAEPYLHSNIAPADVSPARRELGDRLWVRCSAYLVRRNFMASSGNSSASVNDQLSRVVGMLLDAGAAHCLFLLSNDDRLRERVAEALALLAAPSSASTATPPRFGGTGAAAAAPTATSASGQRSLAIDSATLRNVIDSIRHDHDAMATPPSASTSASASASASTPSMQATPFAVQKAAVRASITLQLGSVRIGSNLADNSALPSGAAVSDEDDSPLFWQPARRGLYAPRQGRLTTERLSVFRNVGRVIGLCLLQNETFPALLCRHVLKVLLGRRVSFHDFCFFDSTMYDTLRQLIVDARRLAPAEAETYFRELDLTFAIEVSAAEFDCSTLPSSSSSSATDANSTDSATYADKDKDKRSFTIQLIANGDQIPVTPRNVREYVRLYAEYRMVHAARYALEQMRYGVYDVIPRGSLDGLTAEDLRLLLNGVASIDVSFLRRTTTWNDESGSASAANREEHAARVARLKRWFWWMVERMTETEKQDLLHFWTSSPNLPASELGFQPLPSITIRPPDEHHLPTANTCISRIYIPLYSSRLVLLTKFQQAISTRSFGFI